MIVTVPFGIIADRCGQKLVLFLNAAAEVLFYISIAAIGLSIFSFTFWGQILTHCLTYCT